MCLIVVSLGGFASCKNDPTPDPPHTADRTVLVYMAADNSLTWNGDFGNKNLGQIVRAMDGLKGNMLVYIDLPSEGATLYKIEGDENRCRKVRSGKLRFCRSVAARVEYFHAKVSGEVVRIGAVVARQRVGALGPEYTKDAQ